MQVNTKNSPGVLSETSLESATIGQGFFLTSLPIGNGKNICTINVDTGPARALTRNINLILESEEFKDKVGTITVQVAKAPLTKDQKEKTPQALNELKNITFFSQYNDELVLEVYKEFKALEKGINARYNKNQPITIEDKKLLADALEEIKGIPITFFGTSKFSNQDDFLAPAIPEKPDIILLTLSSTDGLQNYWIKNAREKFPESKIILIYDGYTKGLLTIGGITEDILKENIDLIVCENEIAKSSLRGQLPNFPTDRIFATGLGSEIGLIDQLENSEKYRTDGKQKLKLDADEKSILFIGTTSIRAGGKEKYKNEIEAAIQAASSYAENNKLNNLKFVFRGHPSEATLTFESVKNLAEKYTNIEIIDGSSNICEINEALWACDVVMGLASTELMEQVSIGRPTIFVTIEPGGGFNEQYPIEIKDELNKRKCAFVATQLSELVSAINEAFKLTNSFNTSKALDNLISNRDRLNQTLNIVLSD